MIKQMSLSKRQKNVTGKRMNGVAGGAGPAPAEGAARGDAAHQSVKRPPLERMERIAEWLRNKEYPNCSRIMKAFGVDRKTAWRDIEFMKDRKGLSIEYDEKHHGYFLSGPVPGLPTVAVTEKEMFELYVMHQAVQQYRGTALGQRLEQLFRKFAGQLDNEEQFTLQELDGVLSFRPVGPEEVDENLFELVTLAVRERRWLSFEYRRRGERTWERRRVQPYHVLLWGRLYLMAHDEVRGDVRTFVLGRMRGATIEEERFERPKDFDALKYLERSIGVMTGNGDYRVVIEMDAWLTDVLRSRRWHPSQEVEELPGGGSRLLLRLSCLEEIEQYVLSWGARATVIEPQELRERVGKVARELAERYRTPVES